MPTKTAAEQFLADNDPDFADLIARVGPSRLVSDDYAQPYALLLRSVTYQQLHGRAAEAIFGRVIALFAPHAFPPPEQLLARPDEDLRGCGLSAAKIKAMKDIAQKSLDGIVPDRRTAEAMSDVALIEALTTLRGVGRWTVEMLLISGLGRPDILPVDDFAVREGYRKWKGLEAQPKPKHLAEIGAAWSPYRSTAAWYMWRASEFKS
jgi:DNA-3-methyladenine glycosylase II